MIDIKELKIGQIIYSPEMINDITWEDFYIEKYTVVEINKDTVYVECGSIGITLAYFDDFFYDRDDAKRCGFQKMRRHAESILNKIEIIELEGLE
jgi:hypothetical protein